MYSASIQFVALLCAFICETFAASRLEAYNVDLTNASVSGFSSGAIMAAQLHVIYSSHLMGAGIIAGVPYACASAGITQCTQNPTVESVPAFEGLASAGVIAGNIDSTTNLQHSKVYIFNGQLDSIVRPANGPKIQEFYEHYIPNHSQIKTVLNINAEHGMPTDNYGGSCDKLNDPNYINNCGYNAAYELLNFIYGGNLQKPTAGTSLSGKTTVPFDTGMLLHCLQVHPITANGPKIQEFYEHYIPNHSQIKTVFNMNAEHGMPTDNYGGSCDKLNGPNYINNCGYNAAYELLNFIYGGNLQKPTAGTSLSGKLTEFDQSEFFHFGLGYISYHMDTTGYLYVPSGCLNKYKKCKLHIALHGCRMGKERIQDAFVQLAGYNEVGELNDIIIIYPQVRTTIANPDGCWDWYGYSGITFATNKGFQPMAIIEIAGRVAGSN